MSRQKATILGVLLAICLSLTRVCFAATINADSCSQTHVSAAITLADPGDTVYVPPGQCTWTGGITLSKGITIQGAGVSTVITSNTSALFTTNGGGSQNFRITNMKFMGKSTSGYDVDINGAWTSIRIDNITWNTSSVSGIRLGYSINGDILLRGYSRPHEKVLLHDINYSPAASTAGHPFIKIYGRGGAAWKEKDGFGTDNFVFMEDCTFNYKPYIGYITDTEFAGRFVFRYNTVYNAGISMHDLGSTPGSRGNRAVEIYENNLTCEGSGCSSRPGLNATRGGTGIFFNNTLTGYPSNMYSWPMIYRVAYNNSFVGGGYCTDTGSRTVCQDMYKHCNGGTRDGRPCYNNDNCPGGSCGTDYTCSSNSDCKDYFGNDGVCMQLDGSSDTGYPCRDQTGRGIDNSVGVQASSPIYWYNNTVDGVTNKPLLVSSQYSAYIQQDRDYCNHSPATACGTKGAWTYTPYQYPHPWRGESIGKGGVLNENVPELKSPEGVKILQP